MLLCHKTNPKIGNITCINLEISEMIKGKKWSEKLKLKLNRNIKQQDLWMVSKLKKLIRASVHQIHALIFFFHKIQLAVTHYSRIPKFFNKYLGVSIAAHPKTPLSYGCRFSNGHHIRKLIYHHIEHCTIMDIISNISTYLLVYVNKGE